VGFPKNKGLQGEKSSRSKSNQPALRPAGKGITKRGKDKGGCPDEEKRGGVSYYKEVGSQFSGMYQKTVGENDLTNHGKKVWTSNKLKDQKQVLQGCHSGKERGGEEDNMGTGEKK